MLIDMGENALGVVAVAIPVVGSIALFSFLSVAAWSGARRQERETYYKTEALKKIAESSGEGAKGALELIREQEKNATRHRLEGMKLGGLITAAVGIGMMVFLHSVVHDSEDHGAYLVGLIPLLIGAALLIYPFFLASKETE